MALALFKLDELKYVHMSLSSANQADTLAYPSFLPLDLLVDRMEAQLIG